MDEFIPVEYKVIEGLHSLVQLELEERLNELGRDGWEMVSWGTSRTIFMRR